VLLAAFIWLMYLALEPYVRRYSPDMLMSWSRLIGGRFRDPRVGRDILAGLCAGILIALPAVRAAADAAVSPARPSPHPTTPIDHQPRIPSLDTARPVRPAANAEERAGQRHAHHARNSALTRMLVKRTWLAAMIAGLVVAFVAVSQAGTEYLLLNGFSRPRSRRSTWACWSASACSR